MSTAANDESDAVVRIVRTRGGPLRIKPAMLDIGKTSGESGWFRLSAPPGWDVEPVGPRRWSVRPYRLDPECSPHFRVERLANDGTGAAGHSKIRIPISYDLTSAFDPARSALLIRNRADDLGEFRPNRDVFDKTWPRMPQRLARLLFSGIYSDVVFLSNGPRRGGLCSGMARWAIARSLGDEPTPDSTDDAIQRIAVYHGRQMKDRVLLNALPWFVRGSPSAAYRAVRRDLLHSGMSDRGLDLAVPKLWRKDVVNAVVAEGHTVVPVRLRQEGSRHGSLEVYDPNHPEAVASNTQRAIDFDLLRNRYQYGALVSMNESNVGMIAVRQAAYERAGTAVLALLGSLLFTPARGVRAFIGKPKTLGK